MLVFPLLLLFFHSSAPQSIQGHNPPLFRVGRCRSNTSVDPIINTQTLANENQGFWVFSAVPAVAETDRLAWAHMRADATLSGNIVLSFYTQIQNEELKVGLKTAVEDSILYSTARTLNESKTFTILKIFYLGYSWLRWGFFYICSDDAPDLGVDYRYVVTHGWPLTNSEKNQIRRIDYNNKMRGSLKMIM